MPAFRIASASRRMPVLALALAALSIAAAPAGAAAPPAGKVENSNLDAPLFYQLLLSEIELRDGQAGTAYQLMLDAARRGRDEQLFRRATEMALQARAGDQALSAVLAWRQVLPESADALRYQIQILVALNRIADVEEPLSALLRQTARPALPGLIEAVPRLLGRAADRNAVAAVVERTLRPYADAADTKAPASIAIGRAWLVAGRSGEGARVRAGARAKPIRARKARRCSPSTCCRAPRRPRRSSSASSRRERQPDGASALRANAGDVAAPRRGDGRDRGADQSDPNLAPPWLTLGALELEMKRPREAAAALRNYVRLVEGGAAVNFGAAASAPQGAGGDDEDDTPPNASTALTQAFLLLAQASEQQQDFVGAERWLARVDNPQRRSRCRRGGHRCWRARAR
jgi:tetratricopeptide (TPR) repeat protein